MFEKIVAETLTKYLGDYVDGLDSQNLKIGLWKGDVTLQNLRLKEDALNRFDWPVKVKSGFIGKLIVKVPWHNFSYEPIVVTIERVFLLASPKPQSEWDEKSSKQRERRMKREQLALAQVLKTKQSDGEPDEVQSSMGALISRLVDNLHFSISDVHLRYEDDQGEVPFSMGLTLENLTAKSMDQFWRPAFITSDDIVHKLLSLKNFAVYWNPKERPLHFRSPEEMEELFQKMIWKEKNPRTDLHYIINPICGSLKMKTNKRTATNRSIPRFSLDFEFDDIAFAAESGQYHQLLTLLDNFKHYGSSGKYRKFSRPEERPTANPRGWWVFALDCVLSDVREKRSHWTKEFFNTRREHRKEYIELYKEMKRGSSQAPFDAERLEALEDELSVQDILFFRAHAGMQMKHEPVQDSASTSWLNWMWGYGYQPNKHEIEQAKQFELTPEEIQEIRSIIVSEERLNEALSEDKEHVKLEVNFHLKSGSMTLKSSMSENIMSVIFETFSVSVETRQESLSFTASLDSMKAKDQATSNTFFPWLMAPLETKVSSTGTPLPCFFMHFENNPIKSTADYRLEMNMMPLQIVYSHAAIERIVSFFSRSKASTLLEALEWEARRYLDELSLTATQFKDLANRKILDLNINISAPKIIIPENPQEENSRRLIVDLGNLAFYSDMKEVDEEKEENFYDRFVVNLTSIQLLLASGKVETTTQLLSDAEKSMQLVDKFDFNVTIYLRNRENIVLTQVKVFADLPSLQFYISFEKVANVLRIIKSVTSSFSSAENGSAAPPTTTILDKANNSQTTIGSDVVQLVVESRTLECYFSVPEVSILVSTDNERDLVHFRMLGIYLQGTKRTFDTNLFLCLNQFVIEDCKQAPDSEFKYLATSEVGQFWKKEGEADFGATRLREEEAKDMIQASFLITRRDSPEYENVDQSLALHFNTLHLICNRETIVVITDFFNAVMREVNSIFGSSPESKAESKPTQRATEQAEDNSKVGLKVIADLRHISLTLNKEGHKLAVLSVVNTSLLVELFAKTMKVKGNLGTVSLLDTSSKRKEYAQIFSTSGKHMVNFYYQTFITNEHNYDSLLRLRTNSVQFIYIQRFLSDIQEYATSLKTMRSLISSTASLAAEAAKGAVASASKKVMKFEIEIANPQILFPDNKHSCIRADLGRMTVRNDFYFSEKVKDVLLETINLNIAAINLQAEEPLHGKMVRQTILEDTHVVVEIQFPVHSNPQRFFPEKKIEGDISKIRITLTESQYELIVRVMRSNLKERELHTVREEDIQKVALPRRTASTLNIKNWIVQHTAFLLEGISVSLISREGDPVVSLQMEELSLTVLKLSDDSLKSDFSLDSIVLSDVRPNATNKWKNLLAPGSPNNHVQEKLLRLRYHRNTEGHESVAIYLDHLQGIVVPEAIFAINKFIQPGLSVLQNSKPPKEKDASSTSPNIFEVKVIVTNPEICFPEDATLLDTKALVINSTFLVKYYVEDQTKQVKVLFSKLQVNKCPLNQLNNAVSILEPVDFVIDYIRSPELPQTFNAVFDMVKITFSYRDFVLMKRIVESFSEKEKSTPSSKSSNVKKTEDGQKKMSLKSSGIQLTLIDDCQDQNIPLLNIQLLSVTSDVTMNSVWLNAEAKADYYNPNTAVWEPVIEKWLASVMVEYSASPVTRLIVKSTDRLNINVTKEFFDTLLTTIYAWQVDYYNRLETNYRPLTSPYFLRNETGHKLRYWFGDLNQFKELETGSQEPLILHDLDLKHRDDVDAQPTLEAIQIIPWNPITKLPMNRVGTFLVPLTPQPTDINPHLVYEVSFLEGSKLLTVRSNIAIINKTDERLEVRFELPNQAPKLLLPLEPGERRPIPIDFTKAAISFRPRASFGWSSPIVPPYQTGVSPLRCSGHSDYFCYSMKVVADSEEFYNSQFSITLRPPLVVFNNLAEEVYVKLIQKQSGAHCEETISSSGESVFHKVDVTCNYSMRISIPGYDWSNSVPIEVNAEPATFKILDNLKRPLNLHAQITTTSEGSLRVSLYCRYWMINKTGLRLLYRPVLDYDPFGERLAAGQTAVEEEDCSSVEALDQREWYDQRRSAEYAKPFMYSYNSFNVYTSKTAVKIADSNWSKAISLESPGMVGFLEMTDKRRSDANQRVFELGVSIELGEGQRYGTKIVTFTPRFVLVNKTGRTIFYRQPRWGEREVMERGTEGLDFFSLRADESLPWHWPSRDQPKELCLSLDSLGWSRGFTIDQLGDFAAKVPWVTDELEPYLARVQVQFEKSTCYVVFNSESKEFPPYRIENFTTATVTVAQQTVGKRQKLEPYQAIPYAWDEPSRFQKLIVEIDGSDFVREINLDILRSYPPAMVRLKNQSRQKEISVKVEVFANGPTKVMRIVDMSVHRDPTLYLVDSRVTVKEIIRKEIVLDLAGLGISVIDSTPQEFMFMIFDTIHLEYSNSNHSQILECSISKFQVDNQLPVTMFPCVLAPQKTDNNSFRLRVEKSNVYEQIDYFNHFSIFLDEMQLRLDEAFISLVAKFVKSLQESFHRLGPPSAPSEATDNSLLPLAPSAIIEAKKVYFENLHIHPIRVKLSYASAPSRDPHSLVNTVLGAIGVTLANINGAPLTLQELSLQHPFSTRQELLQRISQHYYLQALRQFYKIVGALDILLNPVSLVNNLGTVREEFEKGLTQGTTSLARNLLYSLFHPASKFAESLGKGIATLSLDENYLKERELSRSEKPHFMAEGIAFGFRDLTTGLYKGFSGLVDPFLGVQQEGMQGLIRGVPRATLGMAVKPVVGVIDFATRVGQAISYSTATQQQVLRSRPPRYIGPDGVILPFSFSRSFGQALLHRLESGKYMDEWYLNHFTIGGNVLMITDKRIMFLSRDLNHRKWSILLRNIRKIEATKDSLIFYLSVHGGSQISERRIHIGDLDLLRQAYVYLSEFLQSSKLMKLEHRKSL